MNRLTAKQLLMINQKITCVDVKASDNLMKKLETISDLPYEQDEMFFYKYKDVIAKASKLGCSIARIKPFAEKNKQTSVVALLTLLELNGVGLEKYDDDLPLLVSFLEAGDLESSCEWIRMHKIDGHIDDQ